MEHFMLVYQIYQSKRQINRQNEYVALNVTPKPNKWRVCWEKLKISFYKCFGYCDPDEYPYGMFDQMFCNGTEPNEHLKLILGYFGALFMTTLLCIFFVFKYPWSPVIVGITCGFVAMFFSYAMFFRLPRCWFLLMLPEFLSSRSRAILILLALSWTMIGPATNAQTNFRSTAEMLACLQEQVNREGQSLKSLAKDNSKARAGKFIEAKESIEKALKDAKNSLKAVYNGFVRIGKVVKKLFQWLDTVTGICTKEAVTPYENCGYWFRVGKENCQKILAHGAVNWLCYIWNAILTVLNFVGCYWLKILQLLCKLPEYIVKIIKEHVLERIKTGLDNAIKKLEEAFEFDVEIKRNISYVEKFESNMTYFREEVKKHIENLKWWFTLLSYIFDAFIWISFGLMVFEAIRYQRKYLSNPRTDNYFLTEELLEADRQRIRLGKETALPLTARETWQYIHATSIWMTTSEKWRTIRPLLTTTSGLVFVIFWISCDYVLWRAMTEQYVVLMEEGGVDVPNYYKIHVQGVGMIANAYRSILQAFAPQNSNEEDLTKKWQKCIIEPSVPDFKLNEYLYIMMAFCYLTVIFKVYLSRLRHAVCSLFWPEQEKKRAVELQNKILILRGSWMYFAQKQLANRKTSKIGMVQVGLQRVAASVPLLGKLIRLVGDEMKICFECNERIKLDDLENYRACEVCGQSFCTDCFYACPTCQSCGGDKMPQALFIDHEKPPQPTVEKKTPTKRRHEVSLMNIYGGDKFVAPSIKSKRSRSTKRSRSPTSATTEPEKTLPGPSSDNRYNLPPRSPSRGRAHAKRFLKRTSKSPSRSRSPIVRKRTPLRKPSPRPVSKSKVRGRTPQRSPTRGRKLSRKRTKPVKLYSAQY